VILDVSYRVIGFTLMAKYSFVFLSSYNRSAFLVKLIDLLLGTVSNVFTLDVHCKGVFTPIDEKMQREDTF
jgi:hypothetical protein